MKAGVLEIGNCKACGKWFSLPADPPKLEAVQEPGRHSWDCPGQLVGMQYTCTRCGYVWRDYIEKEEKK
jgi:uncharacterized Zn finger protein